MESREQSNRRHLVDYLAGKESYDDCVDWMYGVIVNIDQRGGAQRVLAGLRDHARYRRVRQW